MGLKLNATNGGGSVELDVPDTVSTDEVVTLPATAGTALVAPGSTSITVPSTDGTLDRLERNGNILQVVRYQRAGRNGPFSSIIAPSTTAGFVDFMSKSITTKVTNSVILVMFEYNSYNCTRGRIRLLRGSTEISGDPYAHYTSDSTDFVNYKGTLIDDPQESSGTSITYKLQASSSTGTCAFGYGDSGGGGASSLVLVEIAP